MAWPIIKSSRGTSATPLIKMDHRDSSFNVGVGITCSGTANFTLQHTFFDWREGADESNAVWFNYPDMTSITVSLTTINVLIPSTGIRLSQNQDGQATIYVVQAGPVK